MMRNYKIRVNNPAESKEAQELFFELGYDWSCSEKVVMYVDMPILSVDSKGFICCNYRPDTFEKMKCKEITLPQLRDLVAKSKPTEQVLISGADALRALANGEEVEFKDGMNKWENIKHHMNLDLSMFLTAPDWISFRLKPRTIKLELEIPAPFEPKDGEKAYRLAPAIPCGYTEFYLEEDEYEHQLGAWRTELEIKQVVAALRGALKNG